MDHDAEQAHLQATRPKLYDLFLRLRTKVSMADIARYEHLIPGEEPEEQALTAVTVPAVVLEEFLEEVRLLWADLEDTTERLTAAAWCAGSGRLLGYVMSNIRAMGICPVCSREFALVDGLTAPRHLQ